MVRTARASSLQTNILSRILFGSDTYLKDASCLDCAKITRSFEQHVARNIYGHLRIHLNIQTRRSHERPIELPIIVVKEGVETRLNLPINEHPYFMILPVWEPPGLLRSEQPQVMFTGLTSHMYWYAPPTIQKTLSVRDFEPFAIAPAEYKIDVNQFARAIAKIAYCDAIARYGLEEFRPLALPDLILGKYTGISYFVGSSMALPPRREVAGHQHRIDLFYPWATGSMRLLVAHVRLFADSGTTEHGTPIYTVVVGAPKLAVPARRGAAVPQ